MVKYTGVSRTYRLRYARNTHDHLVLNDASAVDDETDDNEDNDDDTGNGMASDKSELPLLVLLDAVVFRFGSPSRKRYVERNALIMKNVSTANPALCISW